MTQSMFRSAPILCADLIDGKDSHHIQLLKAGSFTHPVYGNVEIKLSDLQSMVTNFTDKVRGIDVAIDFSHESDKIAAAWIETVYLSGDDNTELWAKVRWTPVGEESIKNKEYRYVSAEFVFSYVNSETQKTFGPTLLGAGLTNRPFIKEMKPIVELSEIKNMGGSGSGRYPAGSHQEKNLTEKEGKLKMDDKDKMIADLQAQVAELQKKLDADKAQDDAGTEEKDMSDAQAKAKELADLKAENEKLKCAAVKVDQEKKLAERTAVFNQLMQAGKAVEAQREPFMTGDAVKFAESFVKPNLGGNGSSTDAPATAKDKEEAQDMIVKLAEKAVADKRAKDIGSAQSLVLHENPELRKQIYG